MKQRILIATALGLEFTAIEAFLSDTKSVKHPVTGSAYKQGTYKDFDVLLVETGPGNTRATDETGRAIEYFKPDYVFFSGVAGGVKDVQLGDVIAATKTIGFEVGKDDNEFKPRLDTIPSSYRLEQIAKQVEREGNWKSLTKTSNPRVPDAFVKPIACGEKVVVSDRSVTYKYIKQYCSDALAVDMEGNGFMVAARPLHSHAIEIRGISDLIVNKEEADASGYQPIAAANAAAFCFAMLDVLQQENVKPLDISSKEIRKKMVDDLSNLYKQGPEQNNIWERAGGDVTIFTNTTSRKAQWYTAIDELSKGGGGKTITLTTLIDEVILDYPHAQFSFM